MLHTDLSVAFKCVEATTLISIQARLLQGALAPIFASGALFGAYALVKYFPNVDLKTAQNIYFWILATNAFVSALQKPLRACVSHLAVPLDAGIMSLP